MEIKNQNEFAPLPELAGFTFRRFNGPVDYPAMAEIIMSNKDEPGANITDAEEIAIDYAHMPESVLDRDMLFVLKDGNPIAYGRTGCNFEQDDKTWLYNWTLKIRKDWQDKGLEKIMIEWLEAQASLNYQNQHRGEKALLSTIAYDYKTALIQLVSELGYQTIRFFNDMKRDLNDLPQAELPDGIIIKPALPSQFRQVWDADVEAFKDHWGYIIPVEEEYQLWLKDKNYFQPQLWQIAWDGDQIAGMVWNYINIQENEEKNRNRGYTEAISVRRPWRGRGIAKALICRSMQMMKLLNMDEVALGVDSENPSHATKLYTDLGYQTYQQMRIMRKPLE